MQNIPGYAQIPQNPLPEEIQPTLNLIIPYWDIREPNVVFLQSVILASGNWNFHLNVIDFELGRNFYISKYLTIRPHIGLKGTWQEDDLSIRYIVGTETPFELRMKSAADYGGVGIRTGVDNAWYIIRNFCIFGDGALTLLRGRFDVHRKDFLTENLNDTSTTINNRNSDNNFNTIKAVLELAIGFRYDLWWNDDDYHFGIQAGWEEQVWFSHNMHYDIFGKNAPKGDLVLHGLTLKARFDF